MPLPIKIEDAVITEEDGTVTKAVITGQATLDPDPNKPHPSHPINLPPTSDNPEVFFIFAFCPNPPPPHWEWIAMTPGDPPPRPHPEPPPTTTPPGFKPPPADGGWGYFPPCEGWDGGWVYYPAAGEARPKGSRPKG